MRVFIIVTLLVLVGGVSLGFGMGWLQVQPVQREDEKTTLALTLDKGKFNRDAKALGEATVQTGEKVGQIVTDIVTTKQMRLTLTEINSPERFVRGYGDQLEKHDIQIAADTQIRRLDRDVLLESLEEGETVVVAYTEQGGQKVARLIAAK
jgi:hypothetical protein